MKPENKEEKKHKPVLYKRVEIPQSLLNCDLSQNQQYGGDIRIGDLDGDGQVDFVVFRSKEQGMKPCFIGAFSLQGNILWQVGEGGEQPSRPGPVAIHDIDGDGFAEVIHFFIDENKPQSTYDSMDNVIIQIRNGRTGAVKKEASPLEFTNARMLPGEHPANWVHHRIFIANFRGTDTPRDFVVKLGSLVIAMDENLQVLWTYTMPWIKYGNCAAYIPSVGDIDGDGRDEVNGGYFLLDHDGNPLWENELGPNMDSVAITPWDAGNVRAVCSGGGCVMDEKGNAVLKLGKEIVPHGQEVRVANFCNFIPAPQMLIRYKGHTTDAMLVSNDGEVVSTFNLNESPNNTGMETVYWEGDEKPALLYNGGKLWHGTGELFADLPELPEPKGDEKMGWYHCIPANICGDEREEIVLYNPWDKVIYIYTQDFRFESGYRGYKPEPRQYNCRLMD